MSAAALLAAGIVSSNAQSLSIPKTSSAMPRFQLQQCGVNYLITIPFAIGVSNGANENLAPRKPGVPILPDGSSIMIWILPTLKYTTYILRIHGSPIALG